MKITREILCVFIWSLSLSLFFACSGRCICYLLGLCWFVVIVKTKKKELAIKQKKNLNINLTTQRTEEIN